MNPAGLVGVAKGRTRGEEGRDVRPLLIGLHAVMGANAVAGAWYAVGGAPGVPVEWLDGTPFGDYTVPGIILGAVVGGSQLGAALALWRRRPASRRISQSAGAVLATWIAAQVAIIGYVSPLQPIVLCWALATLALAARLDP